MMPMGTPGLRRSSSRAAKKHTAGGYLAPKSGAAPAGRRSEMLAGLDAACELHNLELRAAALRWLVYHSSLDPTCGDGVILGASSLAQIKDNALAASAGPLPREVVDAFDDANAVLHPVATYPFHQAMPL